MKIGVGVCSYNQAALLEATVRSVLGQGPEVATLLVVDNASSDGSVDVVKAITDPRLQIVQLEQNLGGAGGFREASRRLLEDPSLEALALVDCDCILGAGSLRALTRHLAEVDIAGPKVFFADQPGTLQEIGGLIDWNRCRLIHRHRGHDEAQEGVLKGFSDVDFVASCALLARREVFEEIGHFEADYFVYFDDVDWCTRATTAGFRIGATASASAFHQGGSRSKNSHFPTYYAWRNRVRFFLSHTSEPETTRKRLVNDVAQAAATSRCWNQPRCANVIIRATLDGFDGKAGQADLPRERVRLDEAGPTWDGAGPGDMVFQVEHIFESPLPAAHGDAIIRDAFGKTARRSRIDSLLPRYREEKRAVLRRFRETGIGKQESGVSDVDGAQRDESGLPT